MTPREQARAAAQSVLEQLDVPAAQYDAMLKAGTAVPCGGAS